MERSERARAKLERGELHMWTKLKRGELSMEMKIARSWVLPGIFAKAMASSLERIFPSNTPPMSCTCGWSFPNLRAICAPDRGSVKLKMHVTGPSRWLAGSSRSPTSFAAKLIRVFFATFISAPLLRRLERRALTSETLRPM